MSATKSKIISLIMPVIVLSACVKPASNQSTVTTISASAIENANLTPAEKAEQFATAAEQLLTAQGFIQASDFAKLALKEDPSNFRAQLIDTMLSPIILQRGVITRMKKIAASNPSVQSEYLRILDILNLKIVNQHMRDFLTADDASVIPFANEAEFQVLVKSTSNGLEKIRRFALKSSSKTITIHANAFLIPDLNARYIASCEITETGDREYQLVCPPSENRMLVQMDQGEFEFLKDMATYVEGLLLIPASYSLTGVAAAFESNVSTDAFAARAYVSKVLALSTFGNLSDSARMAALRGWTLDMVSGLRWAMQNQSSLCPKGQEDPLNRPGHLFNKGVCVSPYFAPYFAKAETAISLKAQEFPYIDNGHSMITQFNPMLFFTRPVARLNIFAPLQFNECGHLLATGDDTLGGMFPGRDANSVIRAGAKNCETP